MDKELTGVQLMASARTCERRLPLSDMTSLSQSWRAMGLVHEPLGG